MDLTGENRILVKYGLRQLEQTDNPGYRALLAVNGLEGKKLTAYHIGFVIGPCINASGRLDTAKRALELLGAGTAAEAEKLAGDLKALNDSRKDLDVYKRQLNAFEITLTLPGIAGIILGIGMAVDANVIIFARIREEIGAGKSVKGSIKTGFQKALSAILDGNITTLIAAIILSLKGSCLLYTSRCV